MTDTPQEIMARGIAAVEADVWMLDDCDTLYAQAAISALKEAGWENIAPPSAKFAEAVAAEIMKICGEQVHLEDVACWHKAFVNATALVQQGKQ